MGKAADEQPFPSTSLDAQDTDTSEGSCLSCSRLRKLVNFRCMFVLVLGAAVFLSAVFWPPFFHFGDQKDLDLDSGGHDIVASFILRKPAAFLDDHILQLEGDIFDEMSFSSTKVEIISLEPLVEANTTKVVFAVESDLTTQSLIRANFMSLITRQSFLHLTASLFGDPSSFEVLKFRGGITATPDQKAFLMQSVQILFNFTLNYSIDQLLTNFDELGSQLKTGLRLSPYENLYIRLTNLKGSTVAPPTTVESQVLLAVGIPSKSRLKQLAQTITGSHTKNLGLNNTVFGRVKQVQLSSVLQHSLGGDGTGPSPSPSPSPSPQSHPHAHPHHHVVNPAPRISPSPSMWGHGSPAPTPGLAPAPRKNKPAPPPPCHFGQGNRFPWKHNKHSHMAPSPTPGYAPDAAPSQPTFTKSPPPELSPVSLASPPYVAYAPSQPPPKGEIHARPPDVMSMVSPWPSPSCAGISSSNALALPLIVLVVLLL